MAAHLGEAYLRYSFTYGTPQEVNFLYEELELEPGKRLLDVGCGPGRHAVEFAKRGVEVVGIDISPDFTAIARSRAKEAGVTISIFEMDAHELPFEEEFDAAMSLCEGAFGLGLDDLRILRGMARAVKAGGGVVAGAPNVFYVMTHLASSGTFDPSLMQYTEKVQVKGADGSTREFELTNSCYTPREMSWIANGAGLDPVAVWGVTPGGYRAEAPTHDHPELLLRASKPKVESDG